MAPRTKYDLAWQVEGVDQPLQAPEIFRNLQQLDKTSIPVDQTVGTSNGVCSEAFVGNIENLLLGMRQQLRIQILNETYLGNLQIGIFCHLRADWQFLGCSRYFGRVIILSDAKSASGLKH